MNKGIWTFAALGLAAISSASPFAFVAKATWTIDKVDVATNAELPFSTTPFPPYSLAITPTNKLVAADPTGNLWNVTGPPIPMGSTGFTQIGDLDYGVGGLFGFSNANQTLFFFDLSSSSITASWVFPALAALNIEGVAYRPTDGAVFLSGHAGLNNDQLIKVDTTMNTASLVGGLTISDAFSYVSDIDFDASGNLIAMSWFHRDFYTVNTTTAATTLISSGPHRDANAMAIQSVPEPCTIGAIALGIVGMLKRRKR